MANEKEQVKWWKKSINTGTSLKGDKPRKNWIIQGTVFIIIGFFFFWFLLWPFAAFCFYKAYKTKS
jgi:hypothetical protein